MMTMMNMYIVSSWREHLQEADDGMGDGVWWLGGRWTVSLYFLSIVKFSYAVCIMRRGELSRSSDRNGNSIISIMDC